MLNQLFKSILEQDTAPVVICNLDHTIIYMNPVAAIRYGKRGGYELVGRNLLECHNPSSGEMINKVVAWFKADKSNNRVFTFHNEKENKDVYMIALRDDEGNLIGYYEKHEYRNPETMGLYDIK